MDNKEKVDCDLQNGADSQPHHSQIEIALMQKSRLIDNMAYRIRTLSNAVIGFCDLLECEDLDKTQREYVQEIHQAGRGLSNLVEDVLDLAMIESGNLKPVCMDCDLAQLLASIENSVSKAAGVKGLDFEVHASSDLPSLIRTDGNRLKKCLMSLAGNAIKYTQRGYVNILVALEFEQGEAMVRFDIVDTGQGIEQEKLDSIFTPSSQVNEANSSMLMDITLGLNVCVNLGLIRQLVELLGGRITVNSEIDTGSTFSLIIPARVNVQSEQPLVYPPVYHEQSIPHSVEHGDQCLGKVLLVEDEQSNQMVMTLILESFGLQVQSASDGLKALELAKSNEYDLILMDIQLPKMDGCEVTKSLRDFGLQTPIVGLSAGVVNADMNQKIRELFGDYLTKPVEKGQLFKILKKYLPTFMKTHSTQLGTISQ